MPKEKMKTKKVLPAPMNRLARFVWDISAILGFTFAVLTLLGLLDWGGLVLDLWARFLRRWFGWGSFFVIISLSFISWKLLQRTPSSSPEKPPFKMRWSQFLTIEGVFFAMLAFLNLINGVTIQRAEAGMDGGLLGWGLAEVISNLMPPIVGAALILIISLIALYYSFGLPTQWMHWIETHIADNETADQETSSSGSTHPINKEKASKAQIPISRVPPLPEEEDEPSTHPIVRSDLLPALTLLEDDMRTAQPNEQHIHLTAGLLEKTLSEFGITAKVVGYQVGPTVTQYALDPGFIEKSGNDGELQKQKVRVAQISTLAKDLTLALSATRLRIEAPVPGRPYIGIEVPNANATQVRLRSILQSERFLQINSPLAIALGRDVSGKVVVADLAKMPHLLIAGTTGSGKSVCISALAVCLLMNATPQALRLVMIDPKMVELVHFNGMPHLLGKVETDSKRILHVLNWLVAEMERRYHILEESRSRHIQSHNRKVQVQRKGETLPFIVVLIDELADLMMASPEQTEYSLVRLAQLARATGIHLIVATQRPSTDIVTGLIKANFPARLSFAVASSIDSRVILDTSGAETLLGRGDLLFLSPDAGSPLRAQGVMVSDEEIQRVMDFWRKSLPAAARQNAPWDSMPEVPQKSQTDDLLEQAIDIVRKTQRANASLLQRKLRIGFPRAARLLDELEEQGIIGSAENATRGEREVFISPDEEDAQI